MNILEKIKTERVFFDGGFGSLLQAQGLKPGEFPERWNITHSQIVTSIHTDYLNCGCDIITANTFGANCLKFADDELEEIIKSAINNAKTAIKNSGKNAAVALDLGPTGKLLKPMGDLPFEEAVDVFKKTVSYGKKYGADLILIETMSDTYEIKSAVLAAKETCDLPVFVSATFDENGKMLSGGTPECLCALLEGLRVDAIGANCGLGPDKMYDIVEKLCEYSSTPIFCNPNAGLPENSGGKTVYNVTPEDFANHMAKIASLSVAGFGGCCGTTPKHIEKMIETVSELKYTPITKKNITLVTSYSKAVEIGKKPVIIGERINPTGKSKFKAALRENNIEYILTEGLSQQKNGAHILDVNVGLPEIDEPQMLCDAVYNLQSIIDLPLQLDTSDFTAMEKAMRLYNGKPMINSVCGKAESMDNVFPLVQKYGGVVVALTLDESGIPDSPDDRVKIAEKIINEAKKYGIDKKDIVVDTLTMTVATDENAALKTLSALETLDKKGISTVLGVSNVSFGLPSRETLNSNFFTLALQKGLKCAIINPNSNAMTDAYKAYCALTGFDSGFADYIATFSDRANTPAPVVSSDITLYNAIVSGLADSAAVAVKSALKTRKALDIINEDLIPALDKAGQDYENNKIFLPQLLMCANAAKSAFDVIKNSISADENNEKRGKVVIATVKGDVHDIGKNIVKVLLENYNFDVVDLGKDVPPEKIVEAVKQHNVKLVGLSALMTTTVTYMERTIALLKSECPTVKSVVGGAVLTQDYADAIGADKYCKDAMSTVRYACEVYNK